jgi:hypothetical protein
MAHKLEEIIEFSVHGRVYCRFSFPMCDPESPEVAEELSKSPAVSTVVGAVVGALAELVAAPMGGGNVQPSADGRHGRGKAWKTQQHLASDNVVPRQTLPFAAFILIRAELCAPQEELAACRNWVCVSVRRRGAGEFDRLYPQEVRDTIQETLDYLQRERATRVHDLRRDAAGTASGVLAQDVRVYLTPECRGPSALRLRCVGLHAPTAPPFGIAPRTGAGSQR